uniref:Uncharacterized protein n=1 Tax=Cucumis sativus TaxID=3659 RepID=A0A0A0KFJ0_CUCSA
MELLKFGVTCWTIWNMIEIKCYVVSKECLKSWIMLQALVKCVVDALLCQIMIGFEVGIAIHDVVVVVVYTFYIFLMAWNLKLSKISMHIEKVIVGG